MKRILTILLAAVVSVAAFAEDSDGGLFGRKGRSYGFTIGYSSRTTSTKTFDLKNMTSALPSNLGYSPALRAGILINPTIGFGLGVRTGVFVEYSRSVFNDTTLGTWQNIISNTDVAGMYKDQGLDLGEAADCIVRDITVQVPAQLSFKLMPTPKIGIEIYGGPTLQAGVWQVNFNKDAEGNVNKSSNIYLNKDGNNAYRTEDGKYDAWNILVGGGVALEMSHFRLDVSSDWGIRKMHNDLYWNNPITGTITFLF